MEKWHLWWCQGCSHSTVTCSSEIAGELCIVGPGLVSTASARGWQWVHSSQRCHTLSIGYLMTLLASAMLLKGLFWHYWKIVESFKKWVLVGRFRSQGLWLWRPLFFWHRDWTQDLELAKQMLCHWVTFLAPGGQFWTLLVFFTSQPL